MAKKVCVIGTGNAAMSMAFHLATVPAQLTVNLYSPPELKQDISKLKETKQLAAIPELDGFPGVINGVAKFNAVTDVAAEALDGVEVIFLLVSISQQDAVFQSIIPNLNTDQIIVNMPGNFAAIKFREILNTVGNNGLKPTIVDTDSMCHTSRNMADDVIFVSGVKQMLHFATSPAEKSDETYAKIKDLFPHPIKPLPNVLAVGFHNINMILHPPPVLLNVGWIEVTLGQFSLYAEGCSPAVCSVMEALEVERLTVAKAVGLDAKSFLDIDKCWYGDSGQKTIADHIHNGAFNGFYPAPPTVNNRYINEDMAYLMIPIQQLAHKLGIKTPVMDSLVVLAETMLGKPIAAQRNLNLGTDSIEALTKALSML